MQNFKNKDLLLVLIEQAPATTKEELRKSECAELFQLAQDLLNARSFKKVFYDVYAALSDKHQKICLKCILEDPQFRSKRCEIVNKLQAASKYPIELIEYTLGEEERTRYSGIVSPSFSNSTTRFFDEILPTLPKLHIVTFFWRIAKEELKVRGLRGVKFQGTAEEKNFIKSLSFEQVMRLNATNQPWVVIWDPSEQPDEVILDLCFSKLWRTQEEVTKYLDTQYHPTGILFKKNWDNFLHLLSFQQVSMLICQDPQLKDLNQIFGFKEEFVYTAFS